MQLRFQEAQRLQAIATLAGGISHQFNNALASISLSIELICMDLPQGHPLLGHILKMKVSTEKMANLTSQLLAFAEGGRYQTKLIPMADFVKQVLPSVTRDLHPSVKLSTELSPDTLPVKADVTQMQMVLTAVINNSVEAMDGGGSIVVSTANELFPKAGTDTILGSEPGPYVCLLVQDNGKGMDEETRDRIFEPFFTTKFHGRGLGMPAVYGIIRGHRGFVQVDSELGKGTCVRIYLPAAEPEERTPEISEAEPLKGAWTVLLVEDEDVIVDVGKKLLERIGYHVLTAGNGKQALEISSSYRGKIDLVILDVVLPDMRGLDIYQQLVASRPNLKVLVSSGFSEKGPVQEILRAGAEGFIQKPFLLSDLSRRLQEILKSDA